MAILFIFIKFPIAIVLVISYTQQLTGIMGRLDGKVIVLSAAAQGIGRASALVSELCHSTILRIIKMIAFIMFHACYEILFSIFYFVNAIN